MEKLGWNALLPTSTEVISQLQYYIHNLALRESNCDEICQEEVKLLSEIFKSSQFKYKASRFIQVSVLGMGYIYNTFRL
jgi:hypothetical protein